MKIPPKKFHKNKILKEYFSIKEKNPDTIVLFQIGDFFETLFDDARIFAEITGATLGFRNFSEVGKVPQAGIPKDSAEIYVKQLLSENIKVCICPQYKDEKGQAFRKVTRVYTKGTIVEQELLDSSENNFILAIYCENPKKCSLSYADVSTGQFYKTTGTLEEILIEIGKIEPNEILIPLSQENSFREKLTKYNLTFLDDDFFEENLAQNAILKYCKETQKSYTPKLDEIIHYSIASYMSMDNITRRNLELTRTRRYLKKKGSLLWFLNYTKTPMGIRLLKKYISEPLLDIEKIEQRQKAVDELIKNETLLNNVECLLDNFCDLSRICARLSNSTIFPKDLYNIALNADELIELEKMCKTAKNILLKLDEKKSRKVLNLALNIKKALKKDAPNELKSGGLINENYNSNLDYLKQRLDDELVKVKKLEAKLQKEYDINKLKITSSPTLGYYIEVPSSKTSKMPSSYPKKQTLISCTRYGDETLREYEQEIFNLKFQINELEYELYCNIRSQAIKFVEIIRDIAKDIARIDVLVSFARCAINNNLTRPSFNEESIEIKDGFHPSLIKLNNEITKNDAEIKNGSMIILTGANMSGKSTYLKQNAIICLLSQIGSFIPAKEANISIIDKIFIRQGSTDDIINNNSSFMVEMNDLKFIIDNLTNKSLVLLDEPAKSTSEKEGGAIARAFCEYILNHFNSKILIATHNLELTKLEEKYPKRAFNYVIGEADISKLIINDRKIKRGVVDSSMAINTAILAKLPKEIIESAKTIVIGNEQKAICCGCCIDETVCKFKPTKDCIEKLKSLLQALQK